MLRIGGNILPSTHQSPKLLEAYLSLTGWLTKGQSVSHPGERPPWGHSKCSKSRQAAAGREKHGKQIHGKGHKPTPTAHSHSSKRQVAGAGGRNQPWCLKPRPTRLSAARAAPRAGSSGHRPLAGTHVCLSHLACLPLQLEVLQKRPRENKQIKANEAHA